MRWAGYLSSCSPSPGCQAELTVREALVETDAPLSPRPPPPQPLESILQLPSAREPAITLVHMERRES